MSLQGLVFVLLKSSQRLRGPCVTRESRTSTLPRLRRLRAVLVGCKTRTLADLRVEPVVRFLVNLGDEGAGDSDEEYLPDIGQGVQQVVASGPNAWARMSWQASNRPQARSDAGAGR